jgi:hypothetical protein
MMKGAPHAIVVVVLAKMGKLNIYDPDALRCYAFSCSK